MKSVITKEQHGHLSDKLLSPHPVMHDITITANGIDALLSLRPQHLQGNWSRRNYCKILKMMYNTIILILLF